MAERHCPCGQVARPSSARQALYRGVICQVPEGHGWTCEACGRKFISGDEVPALSKLLEDQRVAALEANGGRCLGCWYCSGYRGKRPCFNDLRTDTTSNTEEKA